MSRDWPSLPVAGGHATVASGYTGNVAASFTSIASGKDVMSSSSMIGMFTRLGQSMTLTAHICGLARKPVSQVELSTC